MRKAAFKQYAIPILLIAFFYLNCCGHNQYGIVTKKYILSLDKFENVYKLSKIDKNKLDKIKTLINDVQIEVIFGDWCSDSIENVPRLIKILEEINFDMNKIKFINIDKKRKLGIELIKDKHVERFPTIIFYKSGKEISRIVETPHPTLEDNIIDILTKK
jgi:thiol-disulfide isomerase/thioredoxin